MTLAPVGVVFSSGSATNLPIKITLFNILLHPFAQGFALCHYLFDFLLDDNGTHNVFVDPELTVKLRRELGGRLKIKQNVIAFAFLVDEISELSLAPLVYVVLGGMLFN